MPKAQRNTDGSQAARLRRGSWTSSSRRGHPLAEVLLIGVSLSLVFGCQDQDSGGAPIRVADMTSRDFHGGCLTSGCHEGLADRRWVHGPAATGNCTVCHGQLGEVVEHNFAPVVREARLCFSCHTSSDPGEHMHEPYAEEKCLDCHDPHGGASKSFLLTATPAQLCAKCHEQEQHAYGHAPVVQGDCLACHSPHAANFAHLLTIDPNELCLGCHRKYRGLLPENMESEGLSLANAHQVLVDDGCLACHKVHGGSYPALLDQPSRDLCQGCHQEVIKDMPGAKTVHGAFRGEGSCIQCHSPHASTFDDLLKESPGALCFECHDQGMRGAESELSGDFATQDHVADNVHLPVAEGDCTLCHLAHFSPQRSLLRLDYPDRIYANIEEETYDLCFQCHDSALANEENYRQTGFRDGNRNLHYVHVHQEKGRACDICHQPHGSAAPNLIRKSFSFGPGEWPMPIGFEPSEQGGSCTSACHELVSYDNTTWLTEIQAKSKE